VNPLLDTAVKYFPTFVRKIYLETSLDILQEVLLRVKASISVIVSAKNEIF
jgi:hypothetical protein